MSATHVCVVIPARDAARTLDQQLDALHRQTFDGQLEVVVADNGSIDTTTAVADRWRSQFVRFQVVDASATAGPSFARNAGAAATLADLVLFCDADDVASSDWVEELVSALELHDVVGGPYDLLQLNRARVARWTTDYERHHEPPTALRYLPYAYGGNIGVRREVFAAVGGFNSTFTGHEETDFCWRIQEAGFSLGWSPRAVMHYRLRESLVAMARAKYRSGLTGAQLRAAYDRSGMPPFTLRRQVRILLTHLRQVAALRTSPGREHWLLKLAWIAGCMAGQTRYKIAASRK